MVDLHTHILPGMDDGSKDLRESLEMLRLEQKMGVETLVLTPHYYSGQNSPEKFLLRREQAWQTLLGALEAQAPHLLLGAEVQYFEGMENLESLPLLCIQGTSLLLLEMPFCTWDARMLRTVQEINELNGIQVILAHIDRYLSFPQNSKSLALLRRSGILMQVNTSFFEGWLQRRRALSMLKKGEFQLIGSDCHNLSSRRPNWEPVPEEARQLTDRFSRSLLRQNHISL